MESLIEIVAASLARHGIACPDGPSELAWRRPLAHISAATKPPAEPTALPEHSFHGKSESDPAP